LNEKQKALSERRIQDGSDRSCSRPGCAHHGEGAHVMKKQYSRSQNKTRIIYSDGRTEVVDGQP
jgi:hypothetical protein